MQLKAADEAPAPAKPPTREELREQLKNLPPEERAAKIKEWREKNGLPTRDDMEKRREELKNLSPEERKAKLKEWREQRQAAQPAVKKLTPEEREAKRKEVRERMDKRLAELRKKKADGTLTPEEEKRLARMEEVAKRFDQGGATGKRPLPPALVPTDPPAKPVGEK